MGCCGGIEQCSMCGSSALVLRTPAYGFCSPCLKLVQEGQQNQESEDEHPHDGP